MDAYLVLARKYRPRTFEEVVGQEVVTGVLSGALEEGRVGHAYLFCGPRGTGKTTMARIFAKALNCEKGPRPDPCGECERCLAADAGAEADIVEIDAASHTGVDHIRDLRDQAAYAPMRARNKVYLVDEVHMLSKGAFNALLKTLEEPPPHVKFLFATTEPHKVPDTILSRCQVLKLSPIREEAIAARLGEVFGREGVQHAPGVAEELARRARGGMRDALSMADQLLAISGGAAGVEDLARLGEGSGVRELDELLSGVEAGDRAAVLRGLPVAVGSEAELCAGLLEHLRLCLVAVLCGKDSPHLAGSQESRELLTARAERLGAERLELWLRELLQVRERMRLLPGQERLVLEMGLFELSRSESTLPVVELIERLESLEERLASGGVAEAAPSGDARVLQPAPRREPAPQQRAAPAQAPAAPVAPVAPERAAPPAPPAAQRPAARPANSKPAAQPKAALERTPPKRLLSTDSNEAWIQFLDALARTHGALAEIMRQRGRLKSLDESTAVVEVRGLSASDRHMTSDRRNLAACSKTFSQLMGSPLQVRVDDASSEAKRGADDFTKGVADFFGGVIEDRT